MIKDFEYIDRFVCYCFGGKSRPAPQPAPPAPGIVDVSRAEPDPSQAARYRGEPVGDNTSGRSGGSLLLDAATNARRNTLGGP